MNDKIKKYLKGWTIKGVLNEIALLIFICFFVWVAWSQGIEKGKFEQCERMGGQMSVVGYMDRGGEVVTTKGCYMGDTSHFAYSDNVEIYLNETDFRIPETELYTT